MIKAVYLIGSLRNKEIGEIGVRFREKLPEIEWFNEWWSAGPEADDYWQSHERLMGHTYQQALQGAHAKDVFNFDKTHLDRCDAAVLVHPAGRSSQREAGYMFGSGKQVFDFYPEDPDRFDIMTQFGNGVYYSEDHLLERIRSYT